MKMPPLPPIENVRVSHIAVAVRSIEASAALYRALGGRPGERETVGEQGVSVLPINFDGVKIELLEPLSETTAVGKFIAKRGEGLHHIALQVPDIQTALSECIAAGIGLIDKAPRSGAENCLIAFLDPRTTGGVLIELVQEPTGK